MVTQIVQNRSDSDRNLESYWKANVSLIRNLLLVWGLVSFGGAIIFAAPLSKINFFGVNLAFWIAHQGSIIVFVGLIWYYAWRMDRLDEEYNVEEVRLSKTNTSEENESISDKDILTEVAE